MNSRLLFDGVPLQPLFLEKPKWDSSLHWISTTELYSRIRVHKEVGLIAVEKAERLQCYRITKDGYESIEGRSSAD